MDNSEHFSFSTKQLLKMECVTEIRNQYFPSFIPMLIIRTSEIFFDLILIQQKNMGSTCIYEMSLSTSMLLE